MIHPRFHYRLCVLIALTAMWGSSSVLLAEQPPAMAPAPAESKTAPPPRAKPQVIYHLPRTSSYAATLHSQAKGQSNAPPIDRSTTPSVQMPRAAANEAARAQREPSASPNEKTQRTVKRPKVQSNRSQVRGPKSSKGRGAGNSHGNTSRKK
jgi:hypothetical protein